MQLNQKTVCGALSLVALSLAACGADDTPAQDTGIADVVDVSTGDAFDTTDVQNTEVGSKFDTGVSCDVDTVARVEGAVVDQAEAPIAGAKSQLCVRLLAEDGNLVCLRPEDTGDAGTFDISVPDSAQCMGGGSVRVFVPDAPYATTYCHVDTATDDGVLALDDPITLFSTEAAADLAPYGNPDDPRAVVLPGGFEIAEFVPSLLDIAFDQAAYERLGAARVSPDAAGLCFMDTEVDGLFAFTVEADVERSFAFRFSNDDGYAAGATVELYLLGGIETHLHDGSRVAETEWVYFEDAVVSDDGEWVEGRIPAFTWLGYRLKTE